LNPFYTEILQQPASLRELINALREQPDLLPALPQNGRVLLTGMGASYHAGLIASYMLQTNGIPAIAMEATDLLNYSESLIRDFNTLIFVSQSGSSAEVVPLLERDLGTTVVVGLTNQVASPLAQKARYVLPMHAGHEATVATKTYVNTLAILYLLVQRWTGKDITATLDALSQVADFIDALLSDSERAVARWLDLTRDAVPIYFLGHGPHHVTARQASMMVAEWAKHPTHAASIGAFRHGPIEVVNHKTSAIIFGAYGSTRASAIKLADEMRLYGARVLFAFDGEIWQLPPLPPDEFLAPMLEVIPAQLYAEALARELNVPPGFRHIQKVVTQL
jgi:glutamine---fructose-6-phosphate transaminase (isomerizing)